jgi:hypothetical protein
MSSGVNLFQSVLGWGLKVADVLGAHGFSAHTFPKLTLVGHKFPYAGAILIPQKLLTCPLYGKLPRFGT